MKSGTEIPWNELLARVARKLVTQELRDIDELVLGPTQCAILGELAADPGIFQNVVVERLRLDKSVVSRAVSRLVRCGHVTRVPGGHDRRYRELHPTRSGLAALAVARNDDLSPAQRAVNGFPADDLAQLRTLLQRLDMNLDIPTEALLRLRTLGTMHVRRLDDLDALHRPGRGV